jgi:hypothetical protein
VQERPACLAQVILDVGNGRIADLEQLVAEGDGVRLEVLAPRVVVVDGLLGDPPDDVHLVAFLAAENAPGLFDLLRSVSRKRNLSIVT